MVQYVLQHQTRDLSHRLRLAVGAGIVVAGLALLIGQPLALWASGALAGAGAWQGVAASGVAGAATGLGALALWGLRRERTERMPLFLAASAGMMLAAALFSLLLPALSVAQGPWVGAVPVAAALGWALMGGLDRLLPHLHARPGAADTPLPAHALRLMIVAIAVHNLPEGFAVGAGYGGGASLGAVTALAIGLQNIPEGLVVATAMWSLGASRGRAAAVALATGLIEPVGATVGMAAVGVAPQALPIALGLAAGAMLFVVVDEMLPASWQHWRRGGQPGLPLAFGLGFTGMSLL